MGRRGALQQGRDRPMPVRRYGEPFRTFADGDIIDGMRVLRGRVDLHHGRYIAIAADPRISSNGVMTIGCYVGIIDAEARRNIGGLVVRYFLAIDRQNRDLVREVLYRKRTPPV